MEISIIETKTVPTINVKHNEKSYFFHSKYDPIREAEGWCNNVKSSIKDVSSLLLIGIGAGYHIITLAKMFPLVPITVIEFNPEFYHWFIKSPFQKKLMEIENLTIHLFENLSKKKQRNLFSTLHTSNLVIHKSGLDIMPEAYDNVKKILEDIQFKKNSIKNQIDIMNENFSKNTSLGIRGIKQKRGIYEGRPMILISAGPSLDKQMTLLKKIHDENKVILASVGTALKPLLENNIIPDFFCIIDPNQGNVEQLKGVSLPDSEFFFLSTTNHETVNEHKGDKYIMWQEGFPEAEELARKNGDPIIQSGGSVATALLDLMLYLGGKDIALVGQDLAYTDGLSHAKYSHAQRNVLDNTSVLKTLNYYRTGEVTTAKNLSIYKKWFEDYAVTHPELELINCTEGGAYINNWKHISLKEFYNMVK
ncbi:motility associated factor glycosyltransferase family protein [Paucisalibacillus globulus]|uniref:motility associated factor glycosyltransferase family protein n=1 Tax=Paucisalibacillus globulus TaxID=351095 RepID=UPI00041B38F0|nr:6-hydroxymethylpterin diphosphokinase MptE-like protein [Paucisalibacillus globulus]